MLYTSCDRKLLKSVQCCYCGNVCLLPLVLSRNTDGCIPLGSFPVLLTGDPGCLFCSDISFASLKREDDATLWLCQNVYSLFCTYLFPLLLCPCEKASMCLVWLVVLLEWMSLIYKTRSRTVSSSFQDKNHNYTAGQFFFSYTFFNLSWHVC